MQDAIALSAKERCPSSNTKPWWDQDLSNVAKRVADARIIQHEIQKTTRECSEPTQAIIIRSHNYFKRLCNFKKKNWAMKTLEEAANNDIWRFPNWSKGTRVYLTSSISHGQNRPKAITHKEKCEAIQEELYQL